nr:hypothetical protein [Tanacetum cinerariifolium]
RETTYELMKGSCKSLVELEFLLEEVYKATIDQLDWVNTEGQQYPHNLLKPLPLIPNNRGRHVIPFELFINNDLEYLRGGASSRKYTTFVTKTKAADYGHIKWIEDLTSASESATAEEPMQTTFEMEEPSHPEFETGADDQPIVESSQHPEWFSQQKKPPTLDRDWNKTLPAAHESIQSWISEPAKQSDSRFSFNELMDTPVDFSNFLMTRLKVDTLTPELLAGPTYELMKGSCKSLVELEFLLEEVYKATIDQLDWVNTEEQTVNEQLEAEVLTRLSNSSKTSYVAAADLSEMELKKILIEKIEGKKSIQRSNE